MKFRKKPVEIEAVQWNGENIQEVLDFCYSDNRWKEDLEANGPMGPAIGHVPALGMLDIPTLEGTMNASPGDWIIRGIRGELYPCKPDIFEQTYDKVDATNLMQECANSPEGHHFHHFPEGKNDTCTRCGLTIER